jgi:glucose/mannose-6-phosphate isomerase
MSTILDSRDDIKQLDQENVLGSIEMLPDQIQQVWAERDSIHMHADAFADLRNIVVSGMGGSNLGAHVIKTLYKDTLKFPLELARDYTLPAFVNEHSLVVLSSYSGSTEETLASAEDAKKRGAKIAVVSAGGKLHEFAQREHAPEFLIDPKYNPSGQPRMAIGYSVFAQLALFAKLGLVSITDSEISGVIALLRQNAKGLSPEMIDNNTAKFLAYTAVDKIVTLVSAEHLEGAAHVFNNQLNENAKNFTVQHVLPEMDHHALEGLQFPKVLRPEIVFFLFLSSLYNQRTQKRFPLTLDVIEQNEMHGQLIHAIAPTKLEQVWEVIQLGAYTNFYLAILNGINPAPIPWVDYFKDQLGKA